MLLFGQGSDIYLYSQCNKPSGGSTSQYLYDIPTKYYLNGDKSNFKVLEIEVFCVK